MTDRPYVLTTDRLLLLPIGPEHAPELAEVYADPEVNRYVGGPGIDAAAQATRFRATWDEHGWGQSAVVEKATGRLLGRTGLHSWASWGEVELGYALRRDAWGRGYAQEAGRAWLAWAAGRFEHLIAVIHPDNAASLRTAAALGFRFDRRELEAGVEFTIHRLELREGPAA